MNERQPQTNGDEKRVSSSEKRLCSSCGLTLSRYNKTRRCFSHGPSVVPIKELLESKNPQTDIRSPAPRGRVKLPHRNK